MKNNEVFSLHQGLFACSDLKGDKFAYAVLKNRNKLDSYVKELTALVEDSPEYKKFDEERMKLAEEHAKKDKDGNAVIIEEGGRKSYDIEDQKKFDKAATALRKKYNGAIADRELNVKKFQKKLEQEATVELHMIDEKFIPADITANQLAVIEPIIKRS